MSMGVSEQIRISVFVLITLSLILTACMFVQCVLLIFSATKKNTVQSGGPDSVVVKGGSKKKSRSKRGKTGSRSSSKSKSSKVSLKKLSKSRGSSKESASSLASEAEKKTRPSKKVARTNTPKPTYQRATKIPKTFEGFQTDDFTAGTKTDDLNAKIPDQFGDFTAGVKTSDLNAKIPDQFGDISTEKIRAAIPNQFDNSLAGISNQQLIAGYKTPPLVRQVAEQVIAYLAAEKSPASGLTKTPDSVQSSLPKQASPAPRVYADSFFMMDTGSNGETNKVVAQPAESNATNSLMLDSQKVVPIDGRPEAVTKQAAANPIQVQPSPPVVQQSPPVSAPKAMADSVYIVNQGERPKESNNEVRL